ncbi:MAG: PD-(D/E)XK nuclease family protein [Actinomycetota bacterium]|nr:PD-(D/E)XK nuclease family protein [Actinomycetota bacterium]
MTLTLITGPAKCGKTAAAVDTILAYPPLEAAASVRYVVPTTEAARQVEELIMERTGRPGILGNVVTTFFGLAGEFIAGKGLAGKLISDIQKELTLHKLVKTAQPVYLKESAEFPGFIAALDQIIGELKISLVKPEDLRAALDSAKAGLPAATVSKISELADLYERYQAEILLANDLHDREGLMWRALDILKSEPPDLRHVVFDGFEQMNSVEREFLAVLAGKVPEVAVALTYETDRDEVFGATAPIRQFVLDLGATERVLERRTDDGTALAHLEKHLFGDGAGRRHEASDGTVTVIEGCDRAMEVELAALEIRRLVFEVGYSLSDIVLTARDINSYGELVDRVLADHDIPVKEGKRPLAETALARLLVCCLNIVRGGWPRAEVVRLLKSEMVTDDLGVACRVEIDAKQFGIVGGRDKWLSSWGERDRGHGWRRATLKRVADFEDGLRRAKSMAQRVAAARALIGGFKWHLDDRRVEFRPKTGQAGQNLETWPKAPDARQTNTEAKERMCDYVTEPRRRITQQTGFSATSLAQDAAAAKELQRILDELESSTSLIGETNAAGFMEILDQSIALSSYAPAEALDSIRLAPVTGLSGSRYKAVFILGLVETVFPRQIREEPFLRDRERARLNQAMGAVLPLRRAQADLERWFFYAAVGAAVERLYLCYPLTGETDKESLPSFYLDEVAGLLEGLPRLRRDHTQLAPRLADGRSRTALRRAITYGLAQPATIDAQEAALAYNVLPEAERAALDRVFTDSGERPAAVTDIKLLERLAEDRVYTCTELEVYAACPFMHFCAHTLGLEPTREEIGGLDIGALLHDVLYRLFTEMRDSPGGDFRVRRLNPEATVKRAVEILDEEFDRSVRLVNLPAHAAADRRHDLTMRLRRYLTGEIRQGWEEFAPTYFELAFGSPAKEGRTRDPHSTDEALILGGGERRPLAAAGKMDRVDISSLGALVIDYKAGWSPNILRVKDGLVLQAVLYALALKRVFGLKPVGTEYRPIKAWKPDGYYLAGAGDFPTKRMLDEQTFAGLLADCEAWVVALGEKLRSGRIAVEPLDCKNYCSFRHVCRVDKWT